METLGPGGDSTGRDAAASREPRFWIPAMAVAALIVLAGVIGVGVEGRNFAYYAGYFLLPAAIVAGILYAIAGRGGGLPVGVSMFAAMYAAFMAGTLVVVSVETQNEDQAQSLNRILDQVEAFTEDQWATDDDGMPVRIEPSFEADPNASGFDGEVQRFVAGILNDNAELANAYRVELEQIGWYSILDPARLVADSTMAESRQLLQAGRSTVSKYRTRSREILENSADAIQGLNMSERDKRSFERGYREKLGSSLGQHDAMWDLEEETFDEFEKIIDLLDGSSGEWSVEDGQFLFTTDEQVDRFNGYLGRIDAIMLEQQEMQRSALEATRQQIQ